MRHPQPKHHAPLRRLLAAVALGATTLVAGAPLARACGMEMFYVRPARRTPEVLLAQARRHLAKHENVHAVLAAQTVIDRHDATATQRAEAYAILGWVRWQNGRQADAVAAVASGRELDRVASDAELARVGDSDEARSFRKAVGA
jgi:hypothetical protein